MYKIKVVTNGIEYPLYEPADDELQVIEPDVDLELNTTGKMTFSVPDSNPNKQHIVPLVSEFYAYDGTDEIFCGRMVGNTEDFYNTGSVECEGELAYLLDSVLRPYEFSGSIIEFVDMVLDNHNAQVDIRKQISRGNVTVADTNNYIARENSTYSNSLEALQEKLVGTHGGYLRIRKDSGKRYLDYVYDYGGINDQVIRFGENLLDISRFTDASSVITALIPTGATVDSEDGISSVVDITSVNDGLDYIVNQDGVETYGYIWGHKEWEDVTLPTNLLAKATAYLEEQIALPLTIELSAADLHLIDADISAFRFGYWTRVKSMPHDLDRLFLINKMHISMQHPEENTLTLGKKVTTSTGNSVKNMNEVSARVNQTAKQLSSEIVEKINSATQLITGGTGGYIMIVQDPDNKHPTEILILNAPSAEDATNVIRFNQNGIGFSTTGINGPYANAWTIDGNLIADFITAGLLTVGGQSNGVWFKAINSTGTQIVKIDNSGLYAIAGKIGGLNISSQAIGAQGSSVAMSGAFLSANGEFELSKARGGSWSKLVAELSSGVLGLWTAGTTQGGGGIDVSGGAPGDYSAAWIRWGFADGQRSDGYYVSWYSGSDRRLKKRIKTLDAEFVRAFFTRINPVSFFYKVISKSDTKKTHFGVIAQELEETMKDLGIETTDLISEKELVYKTKTGKENRKTFKYVNYHELHGIELAAIKDLYALVNKLKKEEKDDTCK